MPPAGSLTADQLSFFDANGERITAQSPALTLPTLSATGGESLNSKTKSGSPNPNRVCALVGPRVPRAGVVLERGGGAGDAGPHSRARRRVRRRQHHRLLHQGSCMSRWEANLLAPCPIIFRCFLSRVTNFVDVSHVQLSRGSNLKFHLLDLILSRTCNTVWIYLVFQCSGRWRMTTTLIARRISLSSSRVCEFFHLGLVGMIYGCIMSIRNHKSVTFTSHVLWTSNIYQFVKKEKDKRYSHTDL